MITHVTTHRNTMFRNATDVVQRQLEDLCDRIGSEMEAHVHEVHSRLARDYLAVLVGADVASMQRGVPRAELMLRAEMAPLLGDVDGEFAGIFGVVVAKREVEGELKGESEGQEMGEERVKEEELSEEEADEGSGEEEGEEGSEEVEEEGSYDEEDEEVGESGEGEEGEYDEDDEGSEGSVKDESESLDGDTVMVKAEREW